MTPHDRYRGAEAVLTSRLIAEPYRMAFVADMLHADMFEGENKIARACLELFATKRAYTITSLALHLRLPVAKLESLASRYDDMPLEMAAEAFALAYGQWVEYDIAAAVPSWIEQGYDAERIKSESEAFRRTKGTGSVTATEDWREAIRKDFANAHRGIVPQGVVKPPTVSLQRHIPFHDNDELIVIAGRPGFGKTELALQYLLYNAERGVPGEFFTLEMSPKKLARRLWQKLSGQKFESDMAHLTAEQKAEQLRHLDRILALPIELYSKDATLSQIAGKIRKRYYEAGIKFAVIDYLQLIQSDTAKRNVMREQEVANFSRTMKNLTRELNIPIIALSQLSRKVEDRGGMKKPVPSDLRESGGLEQDADVIALLWRNEPYGIESDDKGILPPEYAEINIAKGREHGIANICCRFNHIKGFYDAEPEYKTSMFPTTEPPNSRQTDFTPSLPESARRLEEKEIPF